jgi:hypothetical protein
VSGGGGRALGISLLPLPNDFKIIFVNKKEICSVNEIYIGSLSEM